VVKEEPRDFFIGLAFLAELTDQVEVRLEL